MQFLDPSATPHPPSRCRRACRRRCPTKRRSSFTPVKPARRRRKSARLQKELPLEIVFKGRFDKSEPTIRHGEDLDLPTYIRKGVALN